jgi:hypothetical protein
MARYIVERGKHIQHAILVLSGNPIGKTGKKLRQNIFAPHKQEI